MTLQELLRVFNAQVNYRITYRGESTEVNLDGMNRADRLRFIENTKVYMVFQEIDGLNICVYRNVNL